MADHFEKSWIEQIKACYVDLVLSVLRHNRNLIIPKLHYIGHYFLLLLRLGVANYFNTLAFEQKNKISAHKMKRNNNWYVLNTSRHNLS